MNFTSDSKLFIDFSATANGSPGAALWLQNITNVKVDDQRSRTILKAIGVQGGAGTRKSKGGVMLTLTENEVAEMPVNWAQLRDEDKFFTLITQAEQNGPRKKYFRCQVSKVSPSINDEGEHAQEIEITCLQAPPPTR